ncbi:hypothetical protein D2T29_12585 [Sinirhodobacter populi]|uniref:Uncharacterized protein n=1 Tax=Paenirhodobacter populi TaxID=2306993 RepID=A0A443KCG9_9RHOB|nr:hypothetical protein [Sinirhodobacter populi]RWR30501.1 hypothetical protein D2T29_12585 [Sinirhodobacter populi]
MEQFRLRVRDETKKVAHSFNCTAGQFIFQGGGLVMLVANALAMPLVFLSVMLFAIFLAWACWGELRT